MRIILCVCKSSRAGQQGGVCPHWGCVLAQYALEWLHKYVCLQLHRALGSSPCQYFLPLSFYPFCFSSRCCGTEGPANLAPVPTHSTRLFIIFALLSQMLPRAFWCNHLAELNIFIFYLVIIVYCIIPYSHMHLIHYYTNTQIPWCSKPICGTEKGNFLH